MVQPGTEEPLFFVDREGEGSDDNSENDDAKENDNAPTKVHVETTDSPLQKASVPEKKITSPLTGRRKPAWVDEEDEDRRVNISQVKRRRKLRKKLGERDISVAEYSQRVQDWYDDKYVFHPTGPGDWAQLPSEKKAAQMKDDEGSTEVGSESDEDNELSGNVKKLLRSTMKVLSERKHTPGSDAALSRPPLVSERLKIRSVSNANHEDPNQAEVRCVDFHPSGQLLLTAGLDKTLRIFQVDGEQNAKVQGVHVKNFPIHSAKFTGGGSQVVLAGRRRFFHQLDLETSRVSTLQTLLSHEERSWENFEVSSDGTKLAFLGQRGKIVLVSNKTKREIGLLRLNDRVANVAFAPENENENHLYATSVDGTVYLWDTRRMSCIDRHKDEGAIHSTSLAASSAHYALGSDSGVVNVYSNAAMRQSTENGVSFGLRTEKPKKTFFNLTTVIDNIAFNGDGKLMAFSSHEKKNAIKIAHIPSMTVFANWPSSRTNVRRVCCMKFSPKGGYLAVGNDKGDVQLFRLASYPAA